VYSFSATSIILLTNVIIWSAVISASLRPVSSVATVTSPAKPFVRKKVYCCFAATKIVLDKFPETPTRHQEVVSEANSPPKPATRREQPQLARGFRIWPCECFQCLGHQSTRPRRRNQWLKSMRIPIPPNPASLRPQSSGS
jgi:hypothetical protein